MIGGADSRSWRRREQPPEDVRHDRVRPELRLKCIVLGSAGAGKTSLLRRYTHGTFEGPAGDGRDNHWRRRTRGADYYTKKVANPLFERSAAISSSVPGRDDDGPSRPSAAESSHVLVQLWDTVGKEALKPQRHPAQYDAKSNFYQFLSIRPTSSSTNNSDYEHRYNNWGFLNGTQERGRGEKNKHKQYSDSIRNIEDERSEQAHQRYRGRTGRSRQNNINDPTGNALLRNIDACMLVYDAT
ncbi:hypothetical protein ACHAW5_011097 [Stephanodiscus triporus]|uniref:Uncharacterized protein n=1 Tax=Stephanodiscus triporus TaxID=2934178 RepID=A0ABD3QMD5_9STRA